MKKILLLSDTHSHIDDVILKYVEQADEVWHAGDIGDLKVTDTIKKLKPLRGVYGNIDDDKARMEFPLNNRFFCEGVDVWITHIGGYPDKYNQDIRAEINKNPPKLSGGDTRHWRWVEFGSANTIAVPFMRPALARNIQIRRKNSQLYFWRSSQVAYFQF